VMSRLKSKLNLDVMTVTGRTMGEEIAEFCPINPKAYDEVIASLESPVHTEGGIAILHGSLAPDGSVVKQIAVSRSMLVHKGPAVVFNSEEESMAGIVNGKIKAGDVVVIRYEGPKGGPGMREMLAPTSVIAGVGLSRSVTSASKGGAPPPETSKSNQGRRIDLREFNIRESPGLFRSGIVFCAFGFCLEALHSKSVQLPKSRY